MCFDWNNFFFFFTRYKISKMPISYNCKIIEIDENESVLQLHHTVKNCTNYSLTFESSRIVRLASSYAILERANMFQFSWLSIIPFDESWWPTSGDSSHFRNFIPHTMPCRIIFHVFFFRHIVSEKLFLHAQKPASPTIIQEHESMCAKSYLYHLDVSWFDATGAKNWNMFFLSTQTTMMFCVNYSGINIRSYEYAFSLFLFFFTRVPLLAT